MDAVGARKSKAGRPSKQSSEPRTISLTDIAEKLGIPKQTASDHLRAAEDYQAAAPATMPATATRR